MNEAAGQEHGATQHDDEKLAYIDSSISHVVFPPNHKYLECIADIPIISVSLVLFTARRHRSETRGCRICAIFHSRQQNSTIPFPLRSAHIPSETALWAPYNPASRQAH